MIRVRSVELPFTLPVKALEDAHNDVISEVQAGVASSETLTLREP